MADLNYPESATRRGRVQGNGQICPTLTTKNIPSVLEPWLWEIDGVTYLIRIRKLTPKECWRLMGFTDEDFEKAQEVNSNTQLYKQAGNSIVVNCLEAIFKNLIGELEKPESVEIRGICDDGYCPKCKIWLDDLVERCPECNTLLDWTHWKRLNEER